MPLNFLSLNVNGLNHPAKRHSLWKTVQALHSDIICIQETHLLSADLRLCTNSLSPHIYHASYATKTRGVIIAIRDKVYFQPSNVTLDPEGRYIILVCSINKTTYTLINLNAPNVHQTKFISKVLRIAKRVHKGHLIVCGDSNLVPDVHMDSTSAAQRRTSPLKNLIASHDLRCMAMPPRHGERFYLPFL